MTGPLGRARSVLFDLDGTLVDVHSFVDYARALTDVRRLVANWSDVTTPETTWDGPARTCMAVLVALSGDPRWRRISDVLELYELAAVQDSVPLPGLTAVLDSTRSLPRAVITQLPESAARATLRRHGIDVDIIVSRRTDLRPKPQPDQLLEAARLAGTAPEDAVMVGDSLWDLEAASAARTSFIGIRGDRDPFPPGTHTVADLVELASAIRSPE